MALYMAQFPPRRDGAQRFLSHAWGAYYSRLVVRWHEEQIGTVVHLPGGLPLLLRVAATAGRCQSLPPYCVPCLLGRDKLSSSQHRPISGALVSALWLWGTSISLPQLRSALL